MLDEVTAARRDLEGVLNALGTAEPIGEPDALPNAALQIDRIAALRQAAHDRLSEAAGMVEAVADAA